MADNPSVSVVVPAYREQDHIAATLGALRSGLATVAPGDALELIVVDDGSDDDTAARATAGGADRVIKLHRNRGKGAAVRAGMLAATGDRVAFTDADLQYPPDRVAAVLGRLTCDTVAVVGTRQDSGAPLLRRLASNAASCLARRLVLGPALAGHGTRLDTQCGLKAFQREVAREVFNRCRVDRFAFDIEVLVVLELLGIRVAAETVVPLPSPRPSRVRLVRDGFTLVRDALRIRRHVRRGLYRVPDNTPGTVVDNQHHGSTRGPAHLPADRRRETSTRLVG